MLNTGAGHSDASDLPAYFKGWRQWRVDIDRNVQPDLVASMTDLSAVADGTVDAIWASHCLEHLFAHEVPVALAEFCRVLNDTGFVCIIVPDIQAVADRITQDRLHEPIYESPAGAVSAHDMLWGFGPAIAGGALSMAHRCGFTPASLLAGLQAAGFAEIALRRRSSLELAGLALREATGGPERRESLLDALQL